MPSFDIASKLDIQEVDNAINIARKELGNRFDFKNSQSEIQFDKKSITLISDDDYKLKQLNDILTQKLIKRGISTLSLDYGKAEPAGGRLIRQKVTFKEGISPEYAKKINKLIKDSKLKVTSQVMDDIVRVTGKKIDDLQSVMALLKSSDIDLPMQFINMRS
jgi:uncharacterized protein YajQ (UPF0234 family)